MNHKNTITRVESLDLLRAIAALLVFGYHFQHTLNPPIAGTLTSAVAAQLSIGWTGVHLFYVLSGFFICTAVLSPANFHVSTYLTRRFLRIAPAYYFSIIIIVLLTHPYFITNPHGLYHLLMNLTFLQHLDIETMGSINGSYWTLSVEWLFYLFMALFAMNLRGKYFWQVLLLGCLFALIWRTMVFIKSPLSDINRFYYSSQFPGVLDEFAAGAAVSWLLINKNLKLTGLRGATAFTVGLAGYILCSVIIIAHGADYWKSIITSVFMPTMMALSFSLLLVFFISIDKSPVIHMAAKYSGLGYLGKISFSFYIWHLPILKAIAVEKYQFTSMLSLAALSLAATILISAASFHLVEERFHKS